MKLSLLFLTCCFCLLATSFGQNLFYWPYPHSAPAARSGMAQWPGAYYRGAYNGGDFAEEPADDEIYGRSKYQLSKRVPYNKPKFDFGGRNFNVPTKQTVTVVTTTYGATTTITLGSTKTCVASSLFSSGPASGLSTTACRRKRDIAQILDNIIEPTSNINQIETTPVISEPVATRSARDIESSRDAAMLDYIQYQEETASPRFGFSVLSSILLGVSTSTSTITIPTFYAFATTPATKAVTLGDTSKVLCLPPGFSVC